MKAKINEKKALKIVKILLHAKLPLEKINPYKYATPPSVKPLSIEHALYTIFHIPVHHQQRLINFLRKAHDNYNEMKELYNPSYVLRTYANNLENLAILLKKKLGVRYPLEAAKRWYALALFLHNYNDDPLEIFKRNDYDVERILNEIKKVRGFGVKSKYLFLRLFKELGFVSNYKNYEKIEMPVDINDIHVSMRTGVIRVVGNVGKADKRLIKIIQQVWKKTCIKLGVDIFEIDRKLWFIGSVYCSRRLCKECPLSVECESVTM